MAGNHGDRGKGLGVSTGIASLLVPHGSDITAFSQV
jgi:hypothetical protein